MQEDDGSAKDDSDTDKKDSHSVDTSVKKLGVDHFNFEESDPKKSHALSKSHFPFRRYRNILVMCLSTE